MKHKQIACNETIYKLGQVAVYEFFAGLEDAFMQIMNHAINKDDPEPWMTQTFHQRTLRWQQIMFAKLIRKHDHSSGNKPEDFGLPKDIFQLGKKQTYPYRLDGVTTLYDHHDGNRYREKKNTVYVTTREGEDETNPIGETYPEIAETLQSDDFALFSPEEMAHLISANSAAEVETLLDTIMKQKDAQANTEYEPKKAMITGYLQRVSFLHRVWEPVRKHSALIPLMIADLICQLPTTDPNAQINIASDILCSKGQYAVMSPEGSCGSKPKRIKQYSTIYALLLKIVDTPACNDQLKLTEFAQSLQLALKDSADSFYECYSSTAGKRWLSSAKQLLQDYFQVESSTILPVKSLSVQTLFRLSLRVYPERAKDPEEFMNYFLMHNTIENLRPKLLEFVKNLDHVSKVMWVKHFVEMGDKTLIQECIAYYLEPDKHSAYFSNFEWETPWLALLPHTNLDQIKMFFKKICDTADFTIIKIRSNEERIRPYISRLFEISPTDPTPFLEGPIIRELENKPYSRQKEQNLVSLYAQIEAVKKEFETRNSPTTPPELKKRRCAEQVS